MKTVLRGVAVQMAVTMMMYVSAASNCKTLPPRIYHSNKGHPSLFGRNAQKTKSTFGECTVIKIMS